ncbi:DNA helicase/exodeoxyribonuclease V, subunit A [Oribacterium sp. KHPX15]|uniref:helicase-exonuclease AddAB subunit AddA n=1 Tax=Oribacterium sp. KHPX15 TaxID=1855342 RepID=UPI000899F16A|nr:helicase-exonuclease AddAB subunit AddA [Oribacterium sp. KHPX15]SDZ81863.1 DNA helicase/exodeoxyribonuclease V, subunit A [Oribacterium sp. KHPX15]
MKWTSDQQKVIDHKEGNLLVAAAAGSGKTAVLVQHVINRITDKEDPVSLDEMVIMTFTDAAAQEMRERIKLAIEARLQLNPHDPGLIREAGNIQNANISTIDSFCKKLITENYAAISLDPGFRIGDTGELKLLKSDVIAEILEEHYAMEDNADFLNFVDSFATGKGDSGIEDIILKLYEFAEANPWPMEYLDKCLNEESREDGDKGWEKYYFNRLKQRIKDDIEAMEDALSICEDPDGPESYIEEFTSELNGLDRLMEASDIKSLYEALPSVNFGRLKTSKAALKDAAKGLRDEVKEDIKDMQKEIVIPDPETLTRMKKDCLSHVTVLIGITKEFIERFQAEKLKRHMLDFGDLEHKALEILYTWDEEGNRKYSDIADDLAKRYREILVDEYQDSNFVQETLIEALSAERFGRPDVFQVGDVKQSIYSFRQAKPELFLQKYNDVNYPTIELSQNFRSRNEVISASNDVFKCVMKAPVGGIDYTDNAALHYGFPNAEYSDELKPEYETELLIMENNSKDAESSSTESSGIENSMNMAEAENKEELGNKEDPMSKEEAEARMIAHRIHELHFGAEEIPYRDIVILTRSPGSWADTIVDVLNEEGIPAYCTSNEGYFNTVEVETVLSILNVIDNPEQDIALAAIMHSAIYDFTNDEMAEIVASRGTLQPIYRGLLAEKDESERSLPEKEMNPEELWERDAEIYGIYAVLDEKKISSSEPIRDELARKLLSFYKDIERYRQMSGYLSIHEILYRIYDETGYYNYVTAMPSGNRRKANLDALVDMALAFEKTSYKGLFDYIRYIEKLKKYDNDQGESSIYSDQDDLVRIMSIHKSKGLQFPVVFLSGLGRKFNKQDLYKKILVDSEYGIGFDYVDLQEKVKIPALKKQALKLKLETEQLGEELRVLYVGMTRAVDKLILTACTLDLQKLLDKHAEAGKSLSISTISSASDFLDWIMMAEGAEKLCDDSGARSINDPVKLKKYDTEMLKKIRAEKDQSFTEQQKALIEQINKVDQESCDVKEILKDFSYVYPYKESTTLYPKHSVSELKEVEIEKFEEERQAQGLEHWHIKADNSDTEVKYNITDNHRSPAIDMQNVYLADSQNDLVGSAESAGMREISDTPLETSVTEGKLSAAEKHYREKAGADVGDAYHHAFEKYDYSDDPAMFMEQLKEKLPENEIELIKESRFETFLQSELAERFREAQKTDDLFREQHFMLRLPHNELFEGSTIPEDVLLQGIIDAFFLEENEIVLVDYKTDHVRDEETLIGRYKKQLDLYARALESITGKTVKEKLIYSVILGKTIAV